MDTNNIVDMFREWNQSHNKENYGRYDAFKAGVMIRNAELYLTKILRIEREDASQAVMDLHCALKEIGGQPTLRDLKKLAVRIKKG